MVLVEKRLTARVTITVVMKNLACLLENGQRSQVSCGFMRCLEVSTRTFN